MPPSSTPFGTTGLRAAGRGMRAGNDGTGWTVTGPPGEWFVAKITGSASGACPAAHSWKEQSPARSGCGYEDLPGGRSGTTALNPLYEFNGGTLATGSFVIARLKGLTAVDKGDIYEGGLGGCGPGTTATFVTRICPPTGGAPLPTSALPPLEVSPSGQIQFQLQTQGTVLAGPVGGAAAKPKFRRLVISDLPPYAQQKLLRKPTMNDLPPAARWQVVRKLRGA